MELKAIVPYTKIDEAYWSCLPLQSNEVQDYTYTIANSISASSIFPFDDNELSTFAPKITIEGLNKDTENIISIDYTNKKVVVNPHKFVFGMSGTGKTTYITSDWLKKYARADNSQMLKHRIVIFDPENEQEERVKKYGGQVSSSQQQDGTLKTVAATTVGGEVQKDGTIKIADKDGNLKLLPQTGEEGNLVLSLLGSLTTIASGLFFVKRRF